MHFCGQSQKPWAKPAGNPQAATPPRAVSETFHGSRVSSAKARTGPRRHTITSSLPADMAMEAVMTNPMVAKDVDNAIVTNPINLMDSSLSISARRSKFPRSPKVSNHSVT